MIFFFFLYIILWLTLTVLSAFCYYANIQHVCKREADYIKKKQKRKGTALGL